MDYLKDKRHEGRITILENWDPDHLQHLLRKFDALGFKHVERGNHAVIQGLHWSALEEFRGVIKTARVVNDDLEAFLPVL